VHTPTVRRLRSVLASNALLLAIGLLAVGVGTELARPFQSASIAFDSQSTVLYFERIITGQRLEAFVPTTPKPLMSVVFGTLFEVTRDWRTLAWLTIAVNALAIAATAALAGRFGGAIAAAFVGVGLINNGSLLFDVGFALATPYALLGLAIAGLAIARERPRYGVAGIALGVAVLARLETLVLVGTLFAALAGRWTWALRTHQAAPPARAWLVPAIALAAIPIMMGHDALLTGDPFNWTRVSVELSAHRVNQLRTATQIAVQLGERYLAIGAVSLLAIVGFVRLVIDRRYWLATALVGLSLGVGTFLVLLGLRHLVVPIRYAAVIDVAVIFAAGIGLTQLSIAVLERAPIARFVERLREDRSSLPAAVAAGAVAIVLLQPYFLADRSLRSAVRKNLTVFVATDRAIPAVREALAHSCVVATPAARVLVPGSIWPRVAVDLGMKLTVVAVTAPTKIDVAAGYPAPCQVVLHIRAADLVTPAWSALEVSRPTQTGEATVAPVLADPSAGVWVVAIR